MKMYAVMIGLLMSILLNTNVKAQNETKLIGGNSFSILFPQKNLADIYHIGLGFYGHADYNLSHIWALRLDVGVNSFSGENKEDNNTDGNVSNTNPEKTISELTAGLKVQLAFFYLEGRGGYFFGFDEFGYVPAVGVRLGKFDLQTNYTIVNKNNFASLRIAFYWAK